MPEAKRARLLWFVYAAMYDLIWDSPLTTHLALTIADAANHAGDVADLGCGTGLIGREFTRRGSSVIGVDTSGSMLERARRKARISSARLADAACTGIPAGTMGAVVMANVLHLHSAPSAILDEAVRIAGPGARIVLSWPTSATNNDELARIDFQTGRGWFRTLRADQLRRFVTLLAFGLRVPRASSASVRAHLDAAVAKHSMTMLDDQIAGGCQHVVTLRVAG